MAFEKAMKMMGGRKEKSGVGHSFKGSEKSTPHGAVGGEHGEEEPADGALHIGHELMKQAHEHSPHGTHMHIHHDGFEYTTHHVGEDGQVHGPHVHEDHEALKSHIDGVFGGAGGEEEPEEHTLGAYGG